MNFKFVFIRIVLAAAAMMALPACEEESVNSSLAELENQIESGNGYGNGSSKAVLLSKAKYKDLKPHSEVCHENKNVRIMICHKPPGNPKNSKTLIIPLAALPAHLKHGGPKHTDHDFVGPCEATPPGDGGPDDDDHSGGDDGGSDDGGDGSGNGDDGTVGIDPIPNWCVEFFEFDNNCDGINDETGFPYF